MEKNMRSDLDRDRPAEDGGFNLTRRRLFQRVGVAIAAATLPSGAAMSAAPAGLVQANQPPSPGKSGKAISPVMATLSTYMSEAGSRALPDEVVEKAKQHILDTLAAMISGSDLLPGREAIKFVRAYGGEKVATVVASDVVVGPIEAALANGQLAHSDETDDSHAPSQSHPGCAVIPSALAMGEQCGIDGEHLVRAVTLGYDIGTRVTMTMGAQNYEGQTHRSTHSIVTIFGAAAASGCAASLNAQQMRWLLDYTAQQSSGIAAWQRDTQHIEKAFAFAGMGARDGVTSALVVQSGWTGVDDIFSGADNFFLANAPWADPAGMIEKLGERYEVTRTNIKKWPVGSPIQAALDAIENLRKRHPFDADQVQKVVVRLATHEAAIVNNREIPDICLQHMVAVMLIDKTVSFRASLDEARMKDPAVLRQRAKVELIPDEELQKLMPLRVAIVDLALTDGTHLTERIDAVRGTPENPMTREEVVAKARDLMAPVLGAATANNLIEKVLALESVKDVRELRPLLQRA
jgi:2-methylcitrate dehydratase PrpD